MNVLPTGRPGIHLRNLLQNRQHPEPGQNECVCISLVNPQQESFPALVAGLRRVLPHMYRSSDDVVATLMRYGMDFSSHIPIPSSESFQKAHAGEILACTYYEECEDMLVPSYKWRLNTSKNQHQLGMDILAFDLTSVPPMILLVAVKTTETGHDGRTPSVIYDALRELEEYWDGKKLDDDLAVIDANFHADGDCRRVFLEWYDPYSQGIPSEKPVLIAVPTIIVEQASWNDAFALPAIRKNFSIPGKVRIIAIPDLLDFVAKVFTITEAAHGAT